MSDTRRVAVVAGARTPFVKAGKGLAGYGPLALAKHATTGLLEHHAVDPSGVDAIAFGVVVPEPRKPNLAREVVLECDLPRNIEAHTVSSYCITGLRTVASIHDAIATGRIESGIAGGVDSLSHSDPSTLQEPSTGLTMGEHMELTVKEWMLPRDRQDDIALASHVNAVAARDKLDAEIIAIEGIDRDSGPRDDTSLEALAGLPPAFAEDGTITAGNASPLTDGAAAVLLMSEERAHAAGREPLAYVRAIEFGAIDPAEGLLMAPAITVPRLLERNGLTLRQFDLIEIHEAFAAQVLANARAWEQGWRGKATSELDWDRVNVNGSSVAIGHPWAATGGRIVTTLVNEMARRDASLGLVSICAAGGMAGAMAFERA